jgi:mersacidin/lichenicidin family type 2 lantibiotic
MSQLEMIRACKDETFCSSLSEEQQGQRPECPAGQIELTDRELEHVDGGATAIEYALFASSIRQNM